MYYISSKISLNTTFNFFILRLAQSFYIFVGLFALLIPMLSACGDKEPIQRTAFITVLQKNILQQKNGHMALLTSLDKKNLGPYAEQFDLLLELSSAINIHHDLEIKNMQRLTLTTLQTTDPDKRKETLAEMEKSLQRCRNLLQQAMASAKAKKANLQQPDDLKTVYDAAYAKVITKQAEDALKVFAASENVIVSISAVNAYMEANPDKARYEEGTASGTNIKILNLTAKTEIIELLAKQESAIKTLAQVIAMPYSPE